MKKIALLGIVLLGLSVSVPMPAKADLYIWNECAYYLEEGVGAAGIEAYEACVAQANANNGINNDPAYSNFMQGCMEHGYGFDFCNEYYYTAGICGSGSGGC